MSILLDQRTEELAKQARDIYKWAAQKNLLRLGQSTINLQEADSLPVMFSAGQASSFKPITAVGINPRRNQEKGGTIFIYTQDRMAKKNRDSLIDNYKGSAPLEFRVYRPYKVAPGTSDSPVSKPQRYLGRVPCGSSVSLAVMRDAGTFGCLVRSNVDGRIYGLSANHVTGGCSNALLGSPILFPGILDVAPGIEDPVTIGHHYRSLAMTTGNPGVLSANNLDAAIFSIVNPDQVSSSQGGHFDTPSSMFLSTDTVLDLEIEKVGRTTDYTFGYVEAMIVEPQPIFYKTKVFVSANESIPFEGVVYYSPTFILRSDNGYFAKKGDSGALVVTTDNPNSPKRALGLIVGGEGDSALMLPIEPILREFDATLVTGHNI